MAKLKATPKNFAEAIDWLARNAGRKYSARIGNNTYLESYTDGTKVDRICVRLHNTNIVTFWHDGRIVLNTGGYRTVTTKERINQFIAGSGRLFQQAGNWYLTSLLSGKDYIPFTEGINLQ